jgi:hypothetical protein
MKLAPISQREAKAFINRHHRHNIASGFSVFQIGLRVDGELIGCAMASLPVSRKLMNGTTLEVTRVCVKEDHRNANSMLYGACARAAAALGYARLVTYTLPEESGASLRAAGWTRDDIPRGGSAKGWASHRWKSGDLFGNPKLPDGSKVRWWKTLTV